MSDLRALYQEVILDHSRRPRNFGRLDRATHHAEGHNPLCGDRVEVFMQIDAGSLNGTLGRSAEKSAIQIIQNRMCHLIGSDAHNDKRRNFCLKEALEHVSALTDKSFSDLLIQNAHKVLKGENIEQDIISVEPKKINLLSKLKSKIWRTIDI